MEACNIEAIREELQLIGIESLEAKKWNDISYFWADRKFKGDIFSKYLITYCTKDAWEKNLFDEASTFVSEVIEPQYYSLANDLSWNLYWISMLDAAEFEALNIHQLLTHTSNTEFTRNFVISREDISKHLPIGTLLSNDVQEIHAPQDQWIPILWQNNNLFCLEKFENGIWDMYWKGGEKPISTIDMLSEDVSKDSEDIRLLKKIEIPTGFRPHCYKEDVKIDFSSVNLLYGTNGAGKTTILHAIEQTMTGKILQKEIAEPGVDDADIHLIVEVGKDFKTIKQPVIVADKKKREKQWYNARPQKNNKIGDKLNATFHRYNCFSVEDPFFFSHRQPDYKDIFAKLLYGPETENQWNNQTKYHEACTKKISDLQKAIKDCKEKMADLEPVKAVQLTIWRGYLAESVVKHHESESTEDILKRISRILTGLSTIAEFEPVASKTDTLTELIQVGGQVSQYRDTYNKLLGVDTSLKELKAQKDLEIANANLARNRVQKILANLKPVRLSIPDIKFWVENETKISEYETTLALKVNLRQSYEEKKRYYEDFKSLKEISKYEPFFAAPQKAELLEKQLGEAQFEHILIENDIKQMEKEYSDIKKAYSQLKINAKKMLALNPDIDHCPLCGTPNITNENIMEFLEQSEEVSQERLQALYDKKEENDEKIFDIQKSLIDCKERIDKQKRILQAVRRATALGFPKSEDPLLQINQVFDSYFEIANQLGEIEENIEQQRAALEPLYIAKTENENFDDLFLSRKSVLDKLADCGYEVNVDISGSMLLNQILEIFVNLDQKQKNLEENIESKKVQQQQTQNNLEESRKKLEDIKKILDDKEKRQHILDKIKIFWETISIDVCDENITAKTLEKQCKDLACSVEEMQSYQTYQKKHNDLKVENELLHEQLNRCIIFEEQIRDLRAPAQFAQQFIQDNISQISELFLNLHAPQEFSKLDIEFETGDLIGYRAGQKVSLHQMSTGQKVAVAIAVFIRMHLTNPTAPKFLLLDEPVSNIDDLNILSLIDVLRELVIQRERQIFITTANRNVAKLFRRKFSFLQKGYQELVFKRKINLHTSIEKHVFNQKTLDKSTIILED